MKTVNYKMVATTMLGLEPVLEEELRKLGAQRVCKLNRAVEFFGDLGFMYKANLNLRTAIRILKPIALFNASSEEELYKGIYNIEWEKYLGIDKTFAISVAGFSSIFHHSKYTAQKTKDALVDSLRDKHGKRPNVNLVSPDIKIHIHIKNKKIIVSLDSSGLSLHKRGYKIASVEAPINEVLAAGLILLSGWDKKSEFYDPMCGSGTILIEADMIAKNIPANIFRKRFGFESWKDFDIILWEKIKNVSRDKIKENQVIIKGSDNSQNSLRACRSNINNALMKDEIVLEQLDFFESGIRNKSNFLIFNPPYGERMNIEVKDFYQKIGNILKRNYQECIVWIISSDLENLNMIGLRPSRKIKVFNGKLECKFLKFEIYEGSKKLKSKID